MWPTKSNYPHVYLRSRDESWDFVSTGNTSSKNPNGSGISIYVGDDCIHPEKSRFTTKKNWDFKKALEKTRALSKIHTIEHPSKDHWILKAKDIINMIEDPLHPAQKVVYARSKEVYFDQKVDSWSYFLSLMHKHKNYQNYFFYYALSPEKAFISCSPEKILKMSRGEQGTHIETESIAGTLLAEELKLNGWGEKEKLEQKIVTNYLMDKFKEISPTSHWSHDDHTVNLHEFSHLKTKIYGHAGKSFFYQFEEVLKEIHPTPAIVGHPKNIALDILREKETKNRDYYASPIGIVTNDFVEYFVGIRSCFIDGSKITYYGGAGLVQGSDPHKEWPETELKINSNIVNLN